MLMNISFPIYLLSFITTYVWFPRKARVYLVNFEYWLKKLKVKNLIFVTDVLFILSLNSFRKLRCVKKNQKYNKIWGKTFSSKPLFIFMESGQHKL